MSKKDMHDHDDPDIEFEDEGASGKDKLDKVKKELQKAKAERQEYLDGWQRARAEYANFKKESEEGRSRLREMISLDILEKFLPVLDSFDMAFSNKESWEAVDKNWRVGVEHIYSQLRSVMNEYGLEEISGTGEAFDPKIHQALETIETDEKQKDQTVEKVIQKGYRKNDFILRPAKVSIYVLKS